MSEEVPHDVDYGVLAVDAEKWHETPAWRRCEVRYVAWSCGMRIVVV